MLAKERQNFILQHLYDKKTIKSSELASLCDVSYETIRRDLGMLQNKGIIKRVHGGAIILNKTLINTHPDNLSEKIYNFQVNSRDHFLDTADINKQIVAKFATNFVSPGDAILIDTGDTMTYFAYWLSKFSNLTIITPSLPVIQVLQNSNNKVISLGGELSHSGNVFVGNITKHSLEYFNVDKAFLSCTGLNLKTGYISDFDEYGIPRDLIRKHSENMYLLVNNEKLFVNALVNNFEISSIDHIIIDSGIDVSSMESLQQYNIDIIVAEN